jgi:hypothetical protein
MIQLQVEDYCQQCPKFNVVSVTDVLYADGEIAEVFSTVMCTNKEFCAYMREQLMKEKENQK